MPDQTSRRDGLTTSLAVKAPVRLASAAAIAALTGLLVVDGVQTVSGDRVLVKNQATSANNGIYDVNSGVWTRSKDCDGNLDLVKGTFVHILAGAVNAGLFYEVTAANPITIGTTALTWALVGAPSNQIVLPLAVAQGGTGQSTASNGLAALGVIQLTAGGGTANAQTATAPAGLAALATNQLYEYTPAATNTGAVTLTVTPAGGAALAAQAIFYDGAAATGSEIVSGVPTLLLYDGARLHIVGYSRKIRASQLGLDSHLINGLVTATPNASALTVALKTMTGADPSPASPVGILFRSVTAADGSYTTLWVTAALSLVISPGSTLGARSGIPFNVWVGIFNDAGTPRFGVMNAVTSVAGSGAGSNVSQIFRFPARAFYNSTAEGGIGAADSAQTFYTDAAVASKAFTPIASLAFSAGLVVAGTWDAAPGTIMPFASDRQLPGVQIQTQRTDTGALATGTTVIPADNTIPQITEGDLYLTQAITSTSGNVLRVRARLFLANSAAAGNAIVAAMFLDANVNAIAVTERVMQSAGGVECLELEMLIVATAASHTITVRAGGSSAGTTSFNGSAGTQRYNGTANSFIEIEELKG